jgi:hypothetical protein
MVLVEREEYAKMAAIPTITDTLEFARPRQGKIVQHVGGMTVCTDCFDIEVIYDDAIMENVYRMTEVTDEGFKQTTWQSTEVPITIFRLLQHLEAWGSKIIEGRGPLNKAYLIGPHIMRGHKMCMILEIEGAHEHIHDPHTNYKFGCIGGDINLEWYDDMLVMTVDDVPSGVSGSQEATQKSG